MKKIPFFLILGVLSIFTACKNPNTTDGSTGSIDSIGSTDHLEHIAPVNIGDLSCDELTALVQKEGTLTDNLSSNEMNSEMLKTVALYKYNGTYYLIAEFQKGGTYIYCDISLSAWSNFKDNHYDSFGRSFHAYIAKAFICNCKRDHR